MHIDGLTPSQGPQGPNRPAGPRKAEPKPGGKSFADAFGKARTEPPSGAPAPAPPSPAAPPAPGPDESMGSHIDTIRFRLQSGYYDSKKVTDALGEKLSDFFDDAV